MAVSAATHDHDDAPPANPVAAQLATFVADLRYEDLPDEVIAAAKRLLLDQLACELIGSTLPWVEPAIVLARMSKGAPEQATTVNHGDRLLAAEAAFLNATFGQACEMDDAATGRAGGHIGTATVPVALAIGEMEGASGKTFLTAMVAGYEVMYRLMRAVSPESQLRGFHSQSIGGPFAGAAVAGRILGLDASLLTHALAIAGSHACGSTEYDQSGGEVKRIHAGLGARGGVHSALLARLGLTGPPTIIEGRRGFCSLYSDRPDIPSLTADLGRSFQIGTATFKMFPTVGALHTTIVACNRLVAEHDLRPDDVADVQVGFTGQAVLHSCHIQQPTDVVGAQYSLAFSVALALARRGHDLSLYMDPKVWSDPELVAIMPRVHGYHDEAATGPLRRCATVTMMLRDGRVLKRVEPYISGSPDNPVSKEQLEDKARRLAGTVLPPERVDALVQAVDSFETIGSLKEFMPLLMRHGARA
jgi:2-methylcitrate dehydratase PrpD